MPTVMLICKNTETATSLVQLNEAYSCFAEIRIMVANHLSDEVRTISADIVEVLGFVPVFTSNPNVVTAMLIFSTDEKYNPSEEKKEELAAMLKSYIYELLRIKVPDLNRDFIGAWPMPQHGAVYM